MPPFLRLLGGVGQPTYVPRLGTRRNAFYDGRVSVGSRPLVPSRLAPAALGHTSRRSPRTLIGGYIALTKPRIIELLLITTVPTMILAQRGWPSTTLVLVTLVGGTLAAGGANAINMYVDRDIDRLMVRTQGRPLVTGLIEPTHALVFAVSLEVLAFAVLWGGANLLSACLALSATLFYVFVYTMWLKRTSRQNIVIGGAAGAVPVLVGWSAVQNNVTWTPVVLFAVIFMWTPPHFWALAIRHIDDYRAAHVPMLPAVAPMSRVLREMQIYTVVMVAFTLALVPVADLGPIYAIGAVVLGGLFIAGTIALSHQPSPQKAMRLFGYSISYITLLFAVLTLDVFIRFGF